jgi:hypothetical protein
MRKKREATVFHTSILRAVPRAIPGTIPGTPVIGQIGMSQRATPGDIERICVAMSMLGKAWPQPFRSDKVSLDAGRDFLTEDRRYQIVIVHSVFHCREDYMVYAKAPEHRHLGLCSPLHSLERWRDRLVGTGAEHIFVFESLPHSLSGWQLWELPGYSIRSMEDRVAHYVKESTK